MLVRRPSDPVGSPVASPPAASPQVPLALQAERCLRSSPYLALRNIVCDSEEGIIVLKGCLPSYYLKQLAQATVNSLAGVTHVVNQIEVMTAPVSAVCR